MCAIAIKGTLIHNLCILDIVNVRMQEYSVARQHVSIFRREPHSCFEMFIGQLIFTLHRFAKISVLDMYAGLVGVFLWSECVLENRER